MELPASDEVRALIADMLATLEDAGGVGIAAPQVYGRSRCSSWHRGRIRAIRTPRSWSPRSCINPEIVERSDEMVKDWEGCLSIPGLRGLVPRHRRIRARYQTPEGRVVEREFTDFVARIFQHEDDHLRGIVFLDRLESTRDVVTEKEYQRQFARPVPDERGRSPSS